MNSPRAHPSRQAPSGRVLDVARAGWGAALVSAPRTVLRVVDRDEPDHRAVVVARVLGARHLLQALVSGTSPGPATLAVGAWVDGAHSLSALTLATLDHRRTRSALIDAAIAGSWGLATHRAAARAARGGSVPPRAVGRGVGRGVEQLADAVLPLLPGARR